MAWRYRILLVLISASLGFVFPNFMEKIRGPKKDIEVYQLVDDGEDMKLIRMVIIR